jgi:hypothetical protein
MYRALGYLRILIKCHIFIDKITVTNLICPKFGLSVFFIVIIHIEVDIRTDFKS